MEGKLTEEQIEERVNGWIEKYMRPQANSYQVITLLGIQITPEEWENKEMQYKNRVMEEYKEKLRQDPFWVPTVLVKGRTTYQIPITCWNLEEL